MHGDLSGRQREDQPAASDIDVPVFQDVAEERAVRLRVLAVDDGVGADDLHCAKIEDPEAFGLRGLLKSLERNTGFVTFDLRLGKAKPSTLMAVGLPVDPRHDGGSQSSTERYAFRLGAFFEMLPDSGREANRARDGRAGPRALPGPAPANVDGDPLRPSKRTSRRRNLVSPWSATVEQAQGSSAPEST